MSALTPAQCRAARGLLGWSQDVLADNAGVSRSTVRDFENARHELHRATESQIVQAIVGAGVLLIPAGDAGPGVRLRSPPAPAR